MFSMARGANPGRWRIRSKWVDSRSLAIAAAPGSAVPYAPNTAAASCGKLSANQARKFEWKSSLEPREAWKRGSARRASHKAPTSAERRVYAFTRPPAAPSKGSLPARAEECRNCQPAAQPPPSPHPPQLSAGRGCPAASRRLGVGGQGVRAERPSPTLPAPGRPRRGTIQMNGTPCTPYLLLPGSA